MRTLRLALLHVLRFVGAFALARYLTRGQLRILCYHGFAVGEEYRTAPYVFIRAVVFERRMAILRRLRVPVMSLEEGVSLLQRGALTDAETVITFDDGWASNLSVGAPILRRYGYPWCVYVTTDHLPCGTPAFNMALAQAVHDSPLAAVTLSGIHPRIDGDYDLTRDRFAAAARLLDVATQITAFADRQRVVRAVVAALQLDPALFFAEGRLQLLSAAEIRSLVPLGVSVQMHTHSHTLPVDSFEEVSTQIELNRAAISALTGHEPRHFCYPSGHYAPHHPEWLRRLGIASAATCDPGLNAPGASLMLLRRYLDNELTTDIEFEAEIVGLRELLRRCRDRLGLIPARASDATTIARKA